MKRLFICMAMLLLATQALAQGKIILDYKGMAFGKEMTDSKYMMKAREQGDLTFYTRYGEDHNFQGVPVKDQYYGYVGNKFCVAMFSAQGPSSYNALKAYFDANYGPARQPKVNVKKFSYDAGDVEIQLEYDDNTKVAGVSYVYTPIMRQVMTPKKK
jgi:hypothetical protein